VDLTQVPGVHTLTAQTSPGGDRPDFSRLRERGGVLRHGSDSVRINRVSGGKILSVKTRKVKNRAAAALRMAAQSLYRSQSYLGHYFSPDTR